MRNLITICSLVATAYFAPQYKDLADKKNTLETKSLELTKEVEAVRKDLAATRRDLQSATVRITQLSASGNIEPAQTTKSNWIDERNRNWQSSLAHGANDNRHAVTVAPQTYITVVPSETPVKPGFQVNRTAPPVAPRPPLNRPPLGIPPPTLNRPSPGIPPASSSSVNRQPSGAFRAPVVPPPTNPPTKSN